MRATALLMLLMLVLLPAMALADVPGLISYQGMLTDDDGVALDTTVSMTFSIYVDSTGPNFVWTETQPSVSVNDGLFNVLLGRVNPIPGTVFDAVSRWLSVRVGSDPALQPRQRIASVGYSFRAAEADTADYARSATAASDGDWTISGPNMYSAVAGDVGIGTATPEEKLHVNYGSIQISGDGDSYLSLIFDDEDTGNEFSIVGHENLKLNTNGITRLAITPNGNVGIGAMPPSSTRRLDVQTTSGLGIYGQNSDASYAALYTENIGGGPAAYFYRGDVIVGLDDVGIGTTTPSAKLHVVGSGGNYGYMGHSSYGVYGYSSGGYGVYGNSSSLYGVGGHSSSGYGVYGTSTTNTGVRGYSTGSYAVYGSNSDGPYGYLGSGNFGAYGYSATNYGVYGSSNSSYGVRGYSSNSYGVYGSYSGGNFGYLGSSSYGVYGYNGGNYGYLGGDDYAVWGYESTNGNVGLLASAGYGVYGQNGGGTHYGGIGGSDKGVYGASSSGYGVYGISSSGYGVYGISGGGYGVYGKSESSSTGTIATYGYHDDDTDGTDYHYFSTMCGVVGHAEYGTDYHCGVQGLTYSGDPGNRASGVHGRFSNLYTIWGSLAYKTSADALYGGYFTSYASGTGKGSLGNAAQTAVGLGSWGDLFGADIHGKIYGVYAEGGNYSLYSHGTVFKDELDVHLQHMEGKSTSVLYTNVSTDVTVQTSGFSTLSKGTCLIEFDDDFKKVVSPDVPVIVTVTPTGNSNGVYVSEVTKDGFTVLENNGGKSSVTVTFIAIGRRAGYEDPQLPAEVISSDYVVKLSRGLHNDADTETDGEGLYYQGGQLTVGKHPSVLPDPDGRRVESEEIKKRRRDILETQEQDRLERTRMEEEHRKVLALQRKESVERENPVEEARRMEEEQRKRLVAEEKRSR